MNFFKKKNKIFISIELRDIKSNPNELVQFFLGLKDEVSDSGQLVIKFYELEDVSFEVINTIISFILFIENSFTVSISIQAEAELFKKLKEANFAPIVSKLVSV